MSLPRIGYRIYFAILLLIAVASANIAGAQEFLKRSGSKIVDGSGNEMQLKGVNLGNWLEPEGYMWQTSSPQIPPLR